MLPIRPMQTAELATLQEIMVDAFEGVSIDEGMERVFGPIAGHDWRWRKARHLEEDLKRPESAVFVAHEAATIAGFISTWIDRPAGIGQIPNIALRAAYRGRGIGRYLIQHALDHFRHHGIRYAKIETLAQNEIGKHLYTSIGFRPVATQIHFLADLMEGRNEADEEGRD